ncbi:hypothetical protein K1T71_005929 [Dendrolimus kikuchii]|uniref:Uncharacterized protein n=1 Tax=Dendrolimus kikuchii TaxID=765133 RepID=A0ACC1D2N6_9NEOP|nr:hypothetical protein K1T71_005929 [Dendrolimus kikuchii]
MRKRTSQEKHGEISIKCKLNSVCHRPSTKADVMIRYNLFILFTFALCNGQTQYTVPPAKLEAIYPKGLRVTVKDDGFSLFAFHGKLNEEMEGLEAGQWARDITRPKNGQWIFNDKNAQLKLGDKIYFWTYVIKDGLGYRQDNGEWTVTEFVDDQGRVVTNPVTPPPRPTPSPVTPSPTPETPRPEPTCQPTSTEVPGRIVCRGELIFSEEFEQTNPNDIQNWQSEVKFPSEPDFPFNVYLPDDTVSVQGGSLVIKPVMLESRFGTGKVNQELDLTSRCTGRMELMECSRTASGAYILPPVMTASLNTRNKFNFKFGKVEVRAKLPSGNWLLPEINLEPKDNLYGSRHYESGFMRVAFTKGNAAYSNKLYGGAVLSDQEPFRTRYLKERVGSQSWTNDYHTYTLIWRPDGIELQVDGDIYGVIDPGRGFHNVGNSVPNSAQWGKGTPMAPLDQMFYISLGLRVGGIGDFPDTPDKPWRNTSSKALFNFWKDRNNWLQTWNDAGLRVDYVRVYAL